MIRLAAALQCSEQIQRAFRIVSRRNAISGGGGTASQIISEAKLRGETGEAVFESSRRDAPNPCFTFLD